MRSLILAATAVLALASAADATTCKDPATHRFIKCHPAVVAAPAPPVAVAAPPPVAVMRSGNGPKCVKGKRCGNSCIKATDICHKP